MLGRRATENRIDAAARILGSVDIATASGRCRPQLVGASHGRSRLLGDRGKEMSQPPLNNPGARYWDDLVEEFDFSPDEKREIRQGAQHMIAEVRAHVTFVNARTRIALAGPSWCCEPVPV
jgi:hypothetical protein